MPATHTVSIKADIPVYTVHKDGVESAQLANKTHCCPSNLGLSFSESAHVLQRRDGEVYVHYVNTDKRMDEWVPEESCRRDGDVAPLSIESTNRKRKHKSYSLEPSALNGFALRSAYGENKGSHMPTEIVMTEEDFDLQHHQQLRAQRNFDVIIFDVWKIKPW